MNGTPLIREFAPLDNDRVENERKNVSSIFEKDENCIFKEDETLDSNSNQESLVKPMQKYNPAGA